MRTPSGRPYVDPGIPREVKALRKAVDLLSRRLDRQPKIPAPTTIVAAGRGPSGSLRLNATSFSALPTGLSVTAWAAEPTPTIGGATPADWVLPHWYYPGDGETIASAPVPAEAGWYQAYGYVNVAFDGGAPANLTMRLATYASVSVIAAHLNTTGARPACEAGTPSLPFYHPAADPQDIYAGSTWVQLDWTGDATIDVTRSQVWMDIVRLS